MTQLIQKTWTNKKEVVIENDSLLIKTKSIREDLEYKIKFEELGFDTVKKRIKTANFPFYFFLLFDFFYIGLFINTVVNQEPLKEQIFWLAALIFFSVMTIAAYYNRNKNVIYLTGGQKVLELLAEKPDILTVSSFIEKIHYSMRQFYKNKYLKFENDTPYETRLNHLKWLKEINALSDNEYDELFANSKVDNIIGFNRTNSEN